MENIIKELQHIVNLEYDYDASRYTSERSEGNYDDVFDDGYECGRSRLAYKIGKLIGMALD